jgi:hypothetical protein
MSTKIAWSGNVLGVIWICKREKTVETGTTMAKPISVRVRTLPTINPYGVVGQTKTDTG